MAESLWIIPFGKHSGEDIEDVDTSYLKWLSDQDWFEEKFKEGFDAVNEELGFREQHRK